MKKWMVWSMKFTAACALLTLVAATAKPVKAQSLGADTIALFPKEVGEFAYADLKKARTMKWYPALEQQMLPERFRQFEKFLASAGIDTNSQVNELTWGLVSQAALSKDPSVAASASTSVPQGEEIVGVALGNFNPDSTEAYFKTAEAADGEVARLHLVCVRVRRWSGRSVFLFCGLEQSRFRPPAVAGTDDCGALWRTRQPAAQRQALQPD